MEAKVNYIARSLKPRPRERGLEGEDDDDDEARENELNANNKLRLWKRIEKIAYHHNSNESPREANDADDDENATRKLSIVATCRKSDQARIYSVYTGTRDSKVFRQKTKLRKVACLTLSASGRYAAAALKDHRAVHVFDLDALDHPLWARIPFPAGLGPTAQDCAPVRIEVSDDARCILAVTPANRVWMYHDEKSHETAEDQTARGVARSRKRARPGWHLVVENVAPCRALHVQWTSTHPHGYALHLSQAFTAGDAALNRTLLALTSLDLRWDPWRSAYIRSQERAWELPLTHREVGGDAVLSIAIAARSSASARMMACAVNFCASARRCPVLVISSDASERAVVVGLRAALRLTAAQTADMYICDLCWTPDAAFIALTLSDGSLCLFTGGGAPVPLAAVSHGPSHAPRLQFRALEAFEAHGKVQPHFALAGHARLPELTWCDGNRNLVHVMLPGHQGPLARAGAASAAGSLEQDLVMPFVSAVHALLGDSADDAGPRATHGFLRASRRATALDRALEAWTMCMFATPVGWTSAERRLAKTVARCIVRCAHQGLRENPLETLAAAARALATSQAHVYAPPQAVYLTRRLADGLVRHEHYYAALHLLRVAEAALHRAAADTAAADATAFDRQWAALGRACLDADPAAAPELNALSRAVLAYAHQRKSAWEAQRSLAAHDRRAAVAFDEGDGPGWPAHAHAVVQGGDDLFLAGNYDEAEAAYARDPRGGFPLMCLLLRRMRLEKAVAVAESWRRGHATRRANEAALALLGAVMAAVFLNDPELAAVPSPCAKPTKRSVRWLDLDLLARQSARVPLWDPAQASFFLVAGQSPALAHRLLARVKDPRHVLQVLGDTRARKRFAIAQRIGILQRHLVAQLVLRDLRMSARIVLHARQTPEPDMVRIALLWVLLADLDMAAFEDKVDHFVLSAQKAPVAQARKVHPAIFVGKLALLLAWSSGCGPAWEHALWTRDEDVKVLPTILAWRAPLRMLALQCWRITTMQSPDPALSAVVRAHDKDLARVDEAFAALAALHDPRFAEILDVIAGGGDSVADEDLDVASVQSLARVEADAAYEPTPRPASSRASRDSNFKELSGSGSGEATSAYTEAHLVNPANLTQDLFESSEEEQTSEALSVHDLGHQSSDADADSQTSDEVRDLVLEDLGESDVASASSSSQASIDDLDSIHSHDSLASIRSRESAAHRAPATEQLVSEAEATEDGDDDEELPSLWVFRDAGQTQRSAPVDGQRQREVELLNRLRDQYEEMRDVLGRVNARQQRTAETQGDDKISAAIEALATRLEVVAEAVARGYMGPLELETKADEEKEAHSIADSSEHAEGLGDEDEMSVGSVLSGEDEPMAPVGLAARRFLDRVRQVPHAARPLREAVQTLDAKDAWPAVRREESEDDDDFFNEKSYRRSFQAARRRLAEVPPEIEGLPPLLKVHPSTTETSRMYRHRVKHVRRATMATQTSVESPELLPASVPPRSPSVASSPASSPHKLEPPQSPPPPPPPSPPPPSPPPAAPQLLNEVEDDELVQSTAVQTSPCEGQKTLGVPQASFVQRARPAMPLDKFEARVSLETSENLSWQPAAHVPPEVYLQIKAHGAQHKLQGWLNQPSSARGYLHIAQLDATSACIAGPMAETGGTSENRVNARFRGVI